MLRAIANGPTVRLELADGAPGVGQGKGQAAIDQSFLWKYGKDPAHPLYTKLSQSERQKLRAAAAKVGIAPVTFDSLRPWLAALTLTKAPLQQAGYAGEAGVDVRAQAAQHVGAVGQGIGRVEQIAFEFGEQVRLVRRGEREWQCRRLLEHASRRRAGPLLSAPLLSGCLRVGRGLDGIPASQPVQHTGHGATWSAERLRRRRHRDARSR